jgi:hypothetical protein
MTTMRLFQWPLIPLLIITETFHHYCCCCCGGRATLWRTRRPWDQDKKTMGFQKVSCYRGSERRVIHDFSSLCGVEPTSMKRSGRGPKPQLRCLVWGGGVPSKAYAVCPSNRSVITTTAGQKKAQTTLAHVGEVGASHLKLMQLRPDTTTISSMRSPWQSIATILVAATLALFLINQQDWWFAEWLTTTTTNDDDKEEVASSKVPTAEPSFSTYIDDDPMFQEDWYEQDDTMLQDDDDEGGDFSMMGEDDNNNERGDDDNVDDEGANNAGDDDSSDDDATRDEEGNDDDFVEDWPAMQTIVDGQTGKLITDAQFLVDFAIIAHPKCATSFTQDWLASHDEIEMHDHEIYAIRSGDPAELVAAMYELKPGLQYTRGFKSPKDVENVNALNVLAQYFPKTKLIIGLRHPVLWFESFYNFRLRQVGEMPPVDNLIGVLNDDMNGVSTDEARFHANLDNLRKTQRTEAELDLIGVPRQSSLPVSPNPVFLYEISQLYDEDETRKLQYVADLKNYLGLAQDMKELVDDSQEKHRNPPPGTINICEHDAVRSVLMEHATAASIWIREYLLASPDVTVSSPDHFKELVEAWMTDPCIARNASTP